MPLEDATTPSIEGLKAYSAGQRATSRGWIRRLPLYSARWRLILALRWRMRTSDSAIAPWRESALGRQSLQRAYQLRHRVNDVERFYIETVYDRDVTGNLEWEQRTLDTSAESYRDRRRDRAAVGSARAGQSVRSRQSGVGSVLRECDRRAGGREQGARAWQGRDVDYAAAFALALSGELPRPQALAEDLAREFPEDPVVQFMSEAAIFV